MPRTPGSVGPRSRRRPPPLTRNGRRVLAPDVTKRNQHWAIAEIAIDQERAREQIQVADRLTARHVSTSRRLCSQRPARSAAALETSWRCPCKPVLRAHGRESTRLRARGEPVDARLSAPGTTPFRSKHQVVGPSARRTGPRNRPEHCRNSASISGCLALVGTLPSLGR